MFSIFKKLSWFFIENWKRYTVAIFLLTIVGILDVIPPKLVGNAIDDIHLGAMTWDVVGKVSLDDCRDCHYIVWNDICVDVSIVWRGLSR